LELFDCQWQFSITIEDTTVNRIELKIDQFGRILIPQEIRGSLGFIAGSTLALTEENGKITLSLLKKEEGSLFKKKNNVLVYTGKLESKKSFENWETQNREERVPYLPILLQNYILL
jgi:AbrB family looped-hinge helix DNA binding protein